MKINKLRIKLKSYDYILIKNTIIEIEKIIKDTDSKIINSIPLPKRKEKFVILISPHVNKDARDQYEIITFNHIIDILNIDQKMMNLLSNLNVVAGVYIRVYII